jgi:hypothetical protein
LADPSLGALGVGSNAGPHFFCAAVAAIRPPQRQSEASFATEPDQSAVLSLRHAAHRIALAGVCAIMDEEVYDEPTDVDAVDGNVVLKGPDAVDVRMTPNAAEETSERLLEGAMKARGQRYFTEE